MKAVVLLSGGLDSATALYFAKAKGFDVYALSFEYGQKHSRELEAAKELTKIVGVIEHKTVGLNLAGWGTSSLTNPKVDVANGDIEANEIPTTYVPARNMIFLSVAASYAEAIGAQDIFIGVSQVDYSGYVDCRQSFIDAMEAAINQGTVCAVEENRPIKVNAPFIDMTKADEIRLGMELGVDYAKSWSCYKGGKTPCGVCDSCLLRAKAFAEAEYPDPLIS